jgi:hypothetical protein
MAMKKTEDPGKLPPPTCKAILLCKDIIIEAGTGNISAIGIFQAFLLRKMPGVVQPYKIFLQLTDGIVDHLYKLTVEVHDLANNEIVAKAGGREVKWPDRLLRLNVIIPVPPMKLLHEGPYDLVVFANGQEIDRQQLSVLLVHDPLAQDEEEGEHHE